LKLAQELPVADLVYPPVISIVKSLWRYLGLKFTIEGEANIPRKGAAIMAINHIGYLDFAIAGTAALPSERLVRFMAKREIFDHPLAGPLMRGMKHISVDRSNGSPSFSAALKALNAGEIIGVFPEATISKSFELKEMKNGVIRLAQESGSIVLPTVLWGSQRIWTKACPAISLAPKYRSLFLSGFLCDFHPEIRLRIHWLNCALQCSNFSSALNLIILMPILANVGRQPDWAEPLPLQRWSLLNGRNERKSDVRSEEESG
jgi:1-acyl-sn-glycerol-3-phosphate acyltransferase